MADTASITRLAAFNTAALQTLGADSLWDSRLTEYLRTDGLQHAYIEWGDYARHYEHVAGEERRLSATHGHGWRNHPDAAELDRRTDGERRRVEATWDELCESYRAAARALVLTPAPTIAAALFKLRAIEWSDLDSSSQMTRRCDEIVAEDMARLAGQPSNTALRPLKSAGADATDGEDAITQYWIAYHAFNNGQLDGKAFDEALFAMHAFVPTTAHDFMRKVEAFHSIDGCPRQERVDALKNQAAALIGRREGREG